MKVKALRTKTVAIMAAEVLGNVTLGPINKMMTKVGKAYNNVKDNIQVDYFKKHLAELSAQDKFDAVIADIGVEWVKDPVIDLACTVRYNVLDVNISKDKAGRYMDAYDALCTMGVVMPQKFITAFSDAHATVYGNPVNAV